MRRMTTQIAAILMTVAFAGPAQAGFIDFGGYGHGQVIDDEYFLSDGLTISADNHNRSFDIAVLFDTGLTVTRDDDLEGPAGRAWAGGNVDPNQAFGNILIVQEIETGCGDGVCDLPDDEGVGNHGGDLIFSFANRIQSFGFDSVDLESNQAANGRVIFFDGVGPSVATISLSDFECAVGPFCDPTVDFGGNNTANHLGDITAAALGITGFDRVVIDLHGSGGIDNIRWNDVGGPQVPEPSLVWLLGSALVGLAKIRRSY